MQQVLEQELIQGLVVRGYGQLPYARFILIAFGDAIHARQWLGDYAQRVTPASERPDRASYHIAFTHSGLKRLGMPAAALQSFSPEFQEGMSTEHRRRILGDHDESDPGNWRWGASRENPVDAVLLLYAIDDALLKENCAAEAQRLTQSNIKVVDELPTHACPDFREHFGFRDGIAQPLIAGLGKKGTPENTVPAGEFVLGYRNQYDRLPASPVVAASTDPNRRLPAAGNDQRDFGRNGTYLVFRQLSQDVKGFWEFVDNMSRTTDTGRQITDCVALASKMVGRWPNGAPLALAPEREDPALALEDAFGYHQDDPYGNRCPVGAHIRRANPRDSLRPDPKGSVMVSNSHRLLRRGRTYGKPVAESMAAEDIMNAESYEGERGLHFICMNTDIARQFEFVQHTWINNTKFEGMYNDVDAITGDHDKKNAGYFTIPGEPVRRRVHGVPRFVHVRGGAYFFLPSVAAVKYLAELR